MPLQTRNAASRLDDLVNNPRETLEVELKNWLDIVNNTNDKAVLAKALIALANHGGGVVLIGFQSTATGVVGAPNQPPNLSGYTPDTVNSVVLAYAEPPFHCDVQILTRETGAQHPVISVPGGHQVPIRAKRDGPNGQTVRMNTYYIRRPGPQSEGPQSGAEWDALIRRCIGNGRDALLDQLRSILSGQSAPPEPEERDQVTRLLEDSKSRWTDVVSAISPQDPRRMPHGHFAIAYKLVGNLRELRGAALVEAIRRATLRYTGWPLFLVPTRQDLQPYLRDGWVECWIPRDGREQDSAHSDFWRISPTGEAFLIRGLQEDSSDRVAPGSMFDLTIPTWRVSEALLHSAHMAREFGDPQARVVTEIEYAGLQGRTIGQFDVTRMLGGEYRSHQNVVRTALTVQADQIADGLPELTGRLLKPVYELFDFFQLPDLLLVEEVRKMRQSRL